MSNHELVYGHEYKEDESGFNCDLCPLEQQENEIRDILLAILRELKRNNDK